MSDDIIIWGAKAISKEVRLPLRATYHALESGALPGFKLGDRWGLRPVTWLRKVEAAEAEQMAKLENPSEGT